MARALRILLIGGDTALWVGLSSSLGAGSNEIVTGKETDLSDPSIATSDIDAIVVVTDPADLDPCAPLRSIRKAHLERRTVVVANAADQRTAAEALGMGVGAYVLRGTSPERLAHVITQVIEGGAYYDAPAAAVLHGVDNAQATGSMMGAARALASALELKDSYTGGHAERVTLMAVRLSEAALLDDAIPSETLEAGFLLHDVGKIGIPDSILNKPASLTDAERRVLNTHPILGERIVAPLGFPDGIRQIIRHHHERWDGLGYPDGLAGHNIPGAARLFSIADSIDAMTSIRPYRRPVTFEDALDEVMAKAGTQFDPHLAALAREVLFDTPIRLYV
jgi:HD-GYP domain-containing protein (c-di-GMP phosphodiesterase class II)